MRMIILCVAALLWACAFLPAAESPAGAGDFKDLRSRYSTWVMDKDDYTKLIMSLYAEEDTALSALLNVASRLNDALEYLHTTLELGDMVSAGCLTSESLKERKWTAVKSAFASIKKNAGAAKNALALLPPAADRDKIRLHSRMQRTVDDMVSTLTREIGGLDKR